MRINARLDDDAQQQIDYLVHCVKVKAELEEGAGPGEVGEPEIIGRKKDEGEGEGEES